MKLCWDNIENIRLTKNGNFIDVVKRKVYYYHSNCKICNEEYLGKKVSDFCCNKCADIYNSKRMKSEWANSDSIYNVEVKYKISKTVRNIWSDKNSIYNTNDYKHKQKQGLIDSINDSRRKNMSIIMKSLWKNKNTALHSDERNKKISKSLKDAWIDKNSTFNSKQYKDSKHIGYKKNNLVYYDTYAPQLDWCEEVRRNDDDPNVLEVKCSYCGRWFIPKFQSMNNRLHYLKGHYTSEYKLYCSESCKNSCPLYHKKPETLMKEDAVRAGRLSWLKMDREVQHELRQMVLERDNHTCRKCGATDKPLHCHHIEPVAINPIESADMDNCITLCVDCHKEAHQKDGCRTGQLRIDIC
jgi:hypothetical protein